MWSASKKILNDADWGRRHLSTVQWQVWSKYHLIQIIMLILSEICQILRQLTLNYKNSECLVITESLYHAEYFYLSPQYRLKKHHKNHQSKIMILVVNEMK